MIGKTNAISGVSAPVPKIMTVSGSIISIADALAQPAVSLDVDINAVQNFNGYDNPWPAGGGKNKWNPTTGGSAEGTYNGITYTKNNDGSYSFSGTATGNTWINFGNVTLSAGTWTASVTKTGSYTGTVSFGANGGAFVSYPNLTTYPRTVTSESETMGNFGINFAAGVAISGTLTLWIQVEPGSTATSWEPYSNICPISGWSNVNVYRESQYDAGATPFATINLNGTVYGGSLNVTTGTLTVTHGYIASYSGESLPSTWISDRDVYSAGATPTTGAQVVYELATPQTIQLSPTTVRMLVGNNTLWADSGDSELQYWARR